LVSRIRKCAERKSHSFGIPKDYQKALTRIPGDLERIRLLAWVKSLSGSARAGQENKKVGNMPPKAASRKKVKSAYVSAPVQRAVRLLKHIVEGDPVENMSETAKALKINRTTLLRLLHTLEMEGFIERRQTGVGYQAGLVLLGLAAQTFFSQDLVQIALPILTRLAEQVGLSAHLGVLDGANVLYLLRRVPNVPLASNLRVGSRLPAHATALGRVLLAHLSDAEVAASVGKKLTRYSEQTAITLDALRRQLAEDRRAGMAWSHGDFDKNISAVAAVVFDFSGSPVAAINVSGPVSVFADRTRRKEISDAVKDAGDEISRRLGWTNSSDRKRDNLLLSAE
jgi:DNA-binding IclR family transcriptional regulator